MCHSDEPVVIMIRRRRLSVWKWAKTAQLILYTGQRLWFRLRFPSKWDDIIGLCKKCVVAKTKGNIFSLLWILQWSGAHRFDPDTASVWGLDAERKLLRLAPLLRVTVSYCNSAGRQAHVCDQLISGGGRKAGWPSSDVFTWTLTDRRVTTVSLLLTHSLFLCVFFLFVCFFYELVALSITLKYKVPLKHFFASLLQGR